MIPEVLKMAGNIFITADHGNAEELTNPRTEEADTEHSIFPVPFWYITPENQHQKSNRKLWKAKTMSGEF